jgi:DNA-binding transcriptional LysR family regulator
MNLRDLKYFIALAEHLHFGRAAAASFVSQPTLSTQVRKLEEELGVVLVERAPRKVMLTPAGRDVAVRARRIVADVEQMREAARRSKDPESGSLPCLRSAIIQGHSISASIYNQQLRFGTSNAHNRSFQNCSAQ